MPNSPTSRPLSHRKPGPGSHETAARPAQQTSLAAFLDRRRQARPADEYREVTRPEWLGFEEHFDQRKVELGGCARLYGTPCQHEHDPHPLRHAPPPPLSPRPAHRSHRQPRRPHRRGPRQRLGGEVENLQHSLKAARGKLAAIDRTARNNAPCPTDLGMPAIRPASREAQ